MTQEIKLQSVQTTAYRTLSLGALVMRGVLEKFYQNIDDPADQWTDQVGMRQLLGWLTRQNIMKHQSAEEKKLFRRPLGKWGADYISIASWRVEAFGTLLWSLSILEELPAYDTLFVSEDLLAAIPLYEPVHPFVNESYLRPEEEIIRARYVAELWHWRTRIAELQTLGVPPPEGTTYAQVIKDTARRACEAGDISEPIEDDFPVFGKAVARLEELELQQVSGIAVERHTALNWLCGYSDDWDETPTDT